ncbi:REST corepressor 1-like isoform X1 [Dermacentor andersoni]|uniref:REST corepressor 1-like isoform X1 n=2 Tax=Dermacentor andersoni TaxID=34620 RepID=UPI0021556C58|nr:REST corepressor 1-like isoform X1 [Dermacentor andersoni]
MVLADRNDDSRIGRRSHTSSPNGHLTDEGSATDESEQDHGMRVGHDFQAVVPDIISATDPCPEFTPERALLVWSPCPDISDSKLDEYMTLAKEKYSYNAEQALGMLFWHKYDLEKAVADLANFTPFPDEWTVEDKVLFEQAFQFHGKNFHKIRQMLPDKTIPSLVKYYYSWKKTRTRTSLMDRQARRLAGSREDGRWGIIHRCRRAAPLLRASVIVAAPPQHDGASDAGSENDSDMEVDNAENKEEAAPGGPCSSCGSPMTQAYTSSKGSLCGSCYQHWKRSGGCKGALAPGGRKHHERQPPARGGGMAANRRRPPRGMCLQYQDLVTMATGPQGQGDAILRAMDSELVALKRQVQNNKQMVSQLRHKTAMGIENLRPPEGNTRVNARWTNDELLIAVQGIRKYGRDFKAIAEVIGNKTEAHVRSFFVNYRRRYNLDAVLQEFEAEHGITPGSDDTKPTGDTDPATPAKDATAAGAPNSPPGSPCGMINPGGGILANGSGGPAGAGNPPPLLRPPPGSPSAQPLTAAKGPTPLTQAAPRSGNWSILQQPPPLIRPTAASAATVHSKPSQMHNAL